MSSSSRHRNGLDRARTVEEARETFAKSFERWLSQQSRDLQSLQQAAEQAQPNENDEQADARVRPLVARVLAHYESYYRAKSASAKRDVLPMFSPSWTSSTENLFLWAGGWRPTTAFHLLYSKSGLQVESRLADLIRGLPTGDLADLTAALLDRIDQLHRKTVRLEKEISEEEAAAQETVADARMVEISHAITEMDGGDGPANALEMIELEMSGKREGMERVLERADQLRLGTLKGVVEILRPTQAVHFLIAAAELHLRVHEFGKGKDAIANGSETL